MRHVGRSVRLRRLSKTVEEVYAGLDDCRRTGMSALGRKLTRMPLNRMST